MPKPEDTSFKFCFECGHKIASSSQFCELCGAAAPQACQHCGHFNPIGGKFCASCGAQLPAPMADQLPPGESPKLTLRQSAAKSLLSERKLVTIMFVDMIDSLAAIRDADPEEAHELFSVAVAVMTKAIHGYAGTVIASTGDGILAVFGAPLAQEDHAVRACHAALSVIERLKEARREHRILDVRIGLYSGEVAVGTSPNDFSIDYEATGATVHIAARLQNAAPAGQAVMGAPTKTLIGEAFATSSLGFKKVKGLEEPLELFVLHGPRGREPTDRQALQDLFVGRDYEMGQLRSCFESAMSGAGCVFLIVGEAGIGKTSLIERFVSSQSGSFRVVKGSVDRYRGAVPFHPFRTLLLDLFGLVEADAEQRSAAVAARIDAAEANREHLEAPLLELFETGNTPPEWHALDPQTRNQLITQAVLRELIRESERQPLVLIIDDLQRTDSASIELTGKLIEAVAGHPIFVLLSSRPEFRHKWTRSGSFREMRLSRLSSAESEDLTMRLISDAATPALRRQLMIWSQGNPLFLRESVRMLVDPEFLGAPPETRPQLKERAMIASPASIRAIIAERIDRLPSEAKEVLLAASVLGEEFAPEVLVTLLEKPRELATRQLEKLEHFEFIRPSRRDGSFVFAFCHPMFQEVSYATLLKRRRAELHAAAFAATQASAATGHGSSAENLAYHAFNGRLWREAVGYCRAAGQRAAERSAPREAAAHLQDAVTALERLEPDEVQLEDQIDIRLELRTALLLLLQVSAAEALVEEAHALAVKLGDKRRLAQIVGLLAVHAYLQGGPSGAVERARESISLARTLEEESVLIAPHICLAQAYYGLGEYGQTIRILERNLAMIARSTIAAPLGLLGRPLMISWYWIAISQAELGRFEEAEELARRMLSHGNDRQVSDAVHANTALGFVLMVKGEYRAALEASREAYDLAERNDFPYLTPVLGSQVALLLAKNGETAEALRFGRYSVQTTQEIGVFAGRSRWYARLAEVCMLAGEAEEARQNLATAIEVAEAAAEAGYLCSALCLRARHARDFGGDLDAARADLARALLIARRLAIGPAFAKCLFELAGLERRLGEAGSAERKYGNALARFRRYGMPTWAERAEREIGPAGERRAAHSA